MSTDGLLPPLAPRTIRRECPALENCVSGPCVSDEMNIAPTPLDRAAPRGVGTPTESLMTDSAIEAAEERRAAVAVSLASTRTARFAWFNLRASDSARIRLIAAFVSSCLR